MPCFSPLQAYRAAGGRVVFSTKEGFADRPLSLPCGQCLGCRVQRAQEWSLRCVHEAALHTQNCFVTLTYRDADLPPNRSLELAHWQEFAKRVRRRFGAFRYIHAGEYGERDQRPHYHGLLFGVDFPDRRHWKDSTDVSPLLEELWGKGFATVGDLTRERAGYVAQYTLKKLTGPLREERYERIDQLTGEVVRVRPEYATMSRRPGVGAGWYEKYRSDVFPSDEIIHEGRRYPVPLFYKRALAKSEPELAELLAARRRARAQRRNLPASLRSSGRGADQREAAERPRPRPRDAVLFPKLGKPEGEQSRERLAVREKVLNARLAQRRREL